MSKRSIVAIARSLTSTPKGATMPKMETLDFEGLDAGAAWAACQEWEDWVYSHLSDGSDFSWEDALRINSDNYARYDAEYGNE